MSLPDAVTHATWQSAAEKHKPLPNLLLPFELYKTLILKKGFLNTFCTYVYLYPIAKEELPAFQK